MIILLPAIITAILFFYSGKSRKDNGVKWAVVGVIGYILGFTIGMVVIGETFVSIFIACAIVYLAHIQLSRSALKSKASN